MNLTTHLNAVLSLRMCGATPPLPDRSQGWLYLYICSLNNAL